MYKMVLDKISEDNQLLMKGQRIVVPKTLRKEILKRLQSSHQGINHTLRRARPTVHWPGLSTDVKSKVRACEACMRYSPRIHQDEHQNIQLSLSGNRQLIGDHSNYSIKFLSGRCLWRNRKFLKPIAPRLTDFPRNEKETTEVEEIVP